MTTSYHPVKDITKKKQTWRLAVMVDDLWTVYKGEDEDHLEMLLKDVNGDCIQTSINKDDVEEWKSKLKEGKTYEMSNFRVSDNDYQFKMTEHKCKLTVVAATTVAELEIPDMSVSPFKFKDFADILKGSYRRDLLVDVIGYVVELGKCVAASGSRKGNIAFTIRDLSDNTVDCTLWDPLSVKFLDAYNSHNDAAPFVFIMRHARIKEAQGQYPLQFTNVWSGTKLLFDDNIPEITAFKASLPKDLYFASQTSNIGSVSTRFYAQSSQGSQYSSDDLFMKNACVIRLGDIKKLKTDTLCVTVVNTNQVLVSAEGWFFRSCEQCNKKAAGLKPPFVCKEGHQSLDPPVKYKLDVEVIDGDDTGTFTFWDSSLDELLGITAADLLAEMEKKGKIDPRHYPDNLDDLMDRTFAFRVKWQYQWKKSSVIFCKDNKELVAKIQEQLPNAETSTKEIDYMSPTVTLMCDVPIKFPVQTFTAEDISKFDLLDDAILSTPNVSATAETDPLVPTKKVVAAQVVPIVPTNIDVADEVDPIVPAQKTPAAKRTARQKSYDDRVDAQLSSTKIARCIKKEK
ncbi:hypothetical protein QL285_065676 [Trifolium repens]|nr:hypothetical protein QL285_065676 [Trifolium repens]